MTLFWALFGLAQPDDPTIPNSELYGAGSGHQLTSFVGHILFMVYFVVMGLVMLNMLIAMMSNSFQEIEVKRTNIYNWLIFHLIYTLFHLILLSEIYTTVLKHCITGGELAALCVKGNEKRFVPRLLTYCDLRKQLKLSFPTKKNKT